MNTLQWLFVSLIALIAAAIIFGLQAVKSAFAGRTNPNTWAKLALTCYAGCILNVLALALLALGTVK